MAGPEVSGEQALKAGLRARRVRCGCVAERFFPGAPRGGPLNPAGLGFCVAWEVYSLFVIREGESGADGGFVGDVLGNSGLATL